MNKLKYLAIGMLIGAFALPFQWIGEPVQLAIGQTVTVDSTQSPIVVNAVADLADLTPSDGQSVIIKTGTEKGLWYYDKDSATATSVSVLNGPGSVGRFLVINNDAGSVAAATAITAAEIDDDSLLELQAFDGSSAKSLTLEELKKTGVQVINVVQHGADPTGVADSTEEVDAAMDAAVAAGAVLYFPKGTYDLPTWVAYSLTSSLTVVCDPGCVIQSDGSDDFIRCGTAANLKWTGGRVTSFAFGFVPMYGSTGGNVFILDNVEIDTCDRGICDAGSNSGEFTKFAVTNCKVHGCESFGIAVRLVDFVNCRIANNEVYDIGGNFTGVWGISVGDATAPQNYGNVSIDGNYVHDIESTSVSASEVGGIHAYCDFAKIVNNTVENVSAAAGTDCEGIYGKVRWAIISSNVAANAGERGEGFITLKGQPRTGGDGSAWGYQSIISNNQIVADRASTTNNTGIYVAIANCLVSGNSIECSGDGELYRGITVAQDDCLVMGNTLYGLTSTASSVLGISSIYGNLTISDNKLSAFTSGGSGGIYGIYIQTSGAALENIAACRNTIRSFTGGTGAQVAIGVAHPQTITNLTIDDNIISDCSQGISTAVTGTATITNVSISRNKIYDLDRAALLVVGIWAQYVHDARINSNTIDDLNGDDITLDARAIYLISGSANQLEDIECCRNQISNVTHSTAANSRDRATYINISGAMDGFSFCDNVVRDCGIGFHNSGMSSIASMVYRNNRSISNTTAWSATTFADDAIVDGNLTNSAPATVNKVVEASTAGSGSPNVLTGIENRKVLTNEGTTAANYHTLPTAVAGLTYTFVVQDADGLRITAATGDTIRLGPNVTATAGYIESTTIGDVVTATAINATEWVGHAYGTWTNGTWSYALADTP